MKLSLGDRSDPRGDRRHRQIPLYRWIQFWIQQLWPKDIEDRRENGRCASTRPGQRTLENNRYMITTTDLGGGPDSGLQVFGQNKTFNIEIN